MKLIIIKTKAILSGKDIQKIREDLERQVKNGMVFLDDRFEYPPIIIDDAIIAEAEVRKDGKTGTSNSK